MLAITCFSLLSNLVQWLFNGCYGYFTNPILAHTNNGLAGYEFIFQQFKVALIQVVYQHYIGQYYRCMACCLFLYLLLPLARKYNGKGIKHNFNIQQQGDVFYIYKVVFHTLYHIVHS